MCVPLLFRRIFFAIADSCIVRYFIPYSLLYIYFHLLLRVLHYVREGVTIEHYGQVPPAELSVFIQGNIPTFAISG
jgi:hypothetical protein